MGMLNKVSWLTRRLAAMSPAEVTHRTAEILKRKKLLRLATPPRPLTEFAQEPLPDKALLDFSARINAVFDFDAAPCPQDPWIFDWFGQETDLRQGLDWHSAGGAATWPRGLPGWKITFKDYPDVGEVRKTFELSRMQFLPPLLLYAQKTGQKEWTALAQALFESWLQENPYLWGVNWASPMEVALRSWQWLVCAGLCEGEFCQRLLRAAIVGLDYVRTNLSAFSSANNHLILELFSLCVGSALLGDLWPAGQTDAYRRSLEAEITRQFYSDGTNREHALHYHSFVVDAWLQANLVLACVGQPGILPGPLARALDHIEAFRFGDGFAEYGDSDDAWVLFPANGQMHYCDYVLILGRLYFDKIRQSDPPLPWRRPPADAASFETEAHPAGQPFFDEAGYYIGRHGDTVVIMDAAELGFGSIAAHGHADCLQVLAAVNGHPLFIDPGSYVYNIQSAMRDYYRSTAVHNTLCFERRNQSEIQGPFLWGKKAAVTEKRLDVDGNYDFVTAAHNGYTPHIHRRQLLVDRQSGAFAIRDLFSGPFVLCFTLSPDVSCGEPREGMLEFPGCGVFFTTGKLMLETVEISRRFLECEPARAVRVWAEDEALCAFAADTQAANNIMDALRRFTAVEAGNEDVK